MTTKKKPSVYVAAVLRANRADRQMTQVALAEKSGLSQPTVSRILSNGRDLKYDELAMMCSGLGIRLGDVVEEANRLAAVKGDTLARILGD